MRTNLHVLESQQAVTLNPVRLRTSLMKETIVQRTLRVHNVAHLLIRRSSQKEQ